MGSPEVTIVFSGLVAKIQRRKKPGRCFGNPRPALRWAKPSCPFGARRHAMRPKRHSLGASFETFALCSLRTKLFSEESPK